MVTDPATAVSSLLYDATEIRWSPELCDLVGLTPGMLPEVLPAATTVGGVTAGVAAQLGVPVGTPVVLGSLDSACEMYAARANAPGQCLLRLATAGGVQLVVLTPTANRQLISYPHLTAPYWYCQAGTNCCASSVRWGTKLLLSELDEPFPVWDAMAAKIPVGADGLLFHPYLQGERAPLWDPQVRGSFIGVSLLHGRGHFARAIYEGTALSIRHALSSFSDQFITKERWWWSVEAHEAVSWLQILADVLGRTLVVAPEVNSTYGVALLGLHSLGYTPADTLHNDSTSIEPISDHVSRYDVLFERYLRVCEQLMPLYHDGV